MPNISLPLKLTLVSIPFIHILSVLFGAPLQTKFYETLLFSAVFSTITIFPPLIASNCNLEVIVRFTNNQILFPSELYATRVAIGGLLSCLSFCIVIPLDWDTWWQKYPIPCIFSVICGGAFGALIAKFEINFGKFKRGKKKPSKII